MKSLSNFTIILLLSISSILNAQNDSIDKQNANLLEEYKQKFEQIEQQRLKDSVRKAELEKRIEALNISDLTRLPTMASLRGWSSTSGCPCRYSISGGSAVFSSAPG